MKKINLIAAAALAVFAAAPAMATTTCSGTIVNIYTGDGGSLYVTLSVGVGFYLATADANTKNVLTMSSLALIQGKAVTVVFTANGVSCTTAGNRTDFVGMNSFP